MRWEACRGSQVVLSERFDNEESRIGGDKVTVCPGKMEAFLRVFNGASRLVLHSRLAYALMDQARWCLFRLRYLAIDREIASISEPFCFGCVKAII